jgi:serine/threonine protein kinase
MAERFVTQTITGTPLYMAPEIFKGTYSFSVDIYALGCILKELTTLSRIDMYTEVGIPSLYSDKLRILCKKMLDTNPEARPTAQEVCT